MAATLQTGRVPLITRSRSGNPFVRGITAGTGKR